MVWYIFTGVTNYIYRYINIYLTPYTYSHHKQSIITRPYRHHTATILLPYRHHTATIPPPYRHHTATILLPYRYHTATIPRPLSKMEFVYTYLSFNGVRTTIIPADLQLIYLRLVYLSLPLSTSLYLFLPL